jgi:hypothetical protein
LAADQKACILRSSSGLRGDPLTVDRAVPKALMDEVIVGFSGVAIIVNSLIP